MKLFICPCGRRAKDHYERTVLNKIDLSEIKEFLSDNELNQLTSFDDFYLWACSNGSRDATYHSYLKMEVGDIVLFVGNNKFKSYAKVIHLMENVEIGDYYWGTEGRDGVEEHWKNLMVIDKVVDLNVDYLPIKNEMSKLFKDPFSNAKFNCLSEDKAEYLFNRLIKKELTH